MDPPRNFQAKFSYHKHLCPVFLNALYFLYVLTVSSLPTERCSTAKYLKLHHPTGYIASVVTEETGCGSQQNPWVITAQPGQKINITLFDFGISGSFNTSSNPGTITAGNSNKRTNYPVYCQQYARIEEKDVARSTIVCGGERREKNVYISVTNEVEVHVMNRRTIGQHQYFLLKYNGNIMISFLLFHCGSI